MKIELKNYKTFTGREGHGFSASLYLDGVKSGVVSDDASGGPLHYTDRVAQDKLDKFANAQPLAPDDFAFERGDTLVNAAVDRLEATKKITALMKTALAFERQDGKLGFTNKIKIKSSNGATLGSARQQIQIEATKFRWMENPETLVHLKAKRYITDAEEAVSLYLAKG